MCAAAKAVARRRRELREILPVDDDAPGGRDRRPAMRCSSVVLPQPEGPTIKSIAPFGQLERDRAARLRRSSR